MAEVTGADFGGGAEVPDSEILDDAGNVRGPVSAELRQLFAVAFGSGVDSNNNPILSEEAGAKIPEFSAYAEELLRTRQASGTAESVTMAMTALSAEIPRTTGIAEKLDAHLAEARDLVANRVVLEGNVQANYATGFAPWAVNIWNQVAGQIDTDQFNPKVARAQTALRDLSKTFTAVNVISERPSKWEMQINQEMINTPSMWTSAEQVRSNLAYFKGQAEDALESVKEDLESGALSDADYSDGWLFGRRVADFIAATEAFDIEDWSAVTNTGSSGISQMSLGELSNADRSGWTSADYDAAIARSLELESGSNPDVDRNAAGRVQ